MRRIALVVPSFPRISETFIVNKVLGLLDLGWDVHVVCDQSEPSAWLHYPSLSDRSDIRARVHKTWPRRSRLLSAALIPASVGWVACRNPGALLRYLRSSRDALRRVYLDATLIALAPDLVHFEFGALAVGREHLKALLDCAFIVSFRGYDLNFVGLENNHYYDRLWHTADALHFLGRDLWQRALKRGCPPKKRHVIIPPAIDLNTFKVNDRKHADNVGTADRPLRILSVGRIEWKKGYEYALEAIRLLEDRGVKCEYRIIGTGRYLEATAYTRHELRLEETAAFLGARPQTTVAQEMQWADVLLHAAVSEGFCNAVLEAQAMQLPVVCSDADGLSENVVNGKTGFIVPRRSSRALAEKLALLARNPNLRQEMGEAGKERVLYNFRLEEQIKAFDQFYRQALFGATRHYERSRNTSP